MSSIYINSTRLMGFAGGAPVTTPMGNGNVVVKLRLSTKRVWMTDDGWKEATDWHNISFFGKRAEEAMKIESGMLLSVEGRNQTYEYDDPNGGSKRYRTEVVVDSSGELQIIGFTSRTRQERGPKPAPSQPSQLASQRPSRPAPAQTPARQPAPAPQQSPLSVDDWNDGIFGRDDYIPFGN